MTAMHQSDVDRGRPAPVYMLTSVQIMLTARRPEHRHFDFHTTGQSAIPGRSRSRR
jgi:hypothetical protein